MADADGISVSPLRSLDDFLMESARFQIPNFKDADKWANRVIQNLLYYQTNYFLTYLVVFAVVGWVAMLSRGFIFPERMTGCWSEWFRLHVPLGSWEVKCEWRYLTLWRNIGVCGWMLWPGSPGSRYHLNSVTPTNYCWQHTKHSLCCPYINYSGIDILYVHNILIVSSITKKNIYTPP